MSQLCARSYLLPVILHGLLLICPAPLCQAVQSQAQQSVSYELTDDTSQIPPNVLRAIYPQRFQTVSHNFSDDAQNTAAEAGSTSPGTELGHRIVDVRAGSKSVQNHRLRPVGDNFFGAPTSHNELSIGEQGDRDTASTQSRFNDELIQEMRASQTPSSADDQAQPLNRLPKSQPTSDSLANEELQATPNSSPSSDSGRSLIEPASHIIEFEPPSIVKSPQRDRRDSTAVVESGALNQWDRVNVPNEETQSSAAFGRQTLAEILAESNQESSKHQPADNQVDGLAKKTTSSAKHTLSANSGRAPSKIPALSETIQCIAISLCLVLAIACLLLLLAKRWLFGGRKSTFSSRNVSRAADDSMIRVLNQLKLDAKSLLYLIQANEQKFLVAVDMSGIKSVVAFSSDFGAALEDLAEPKLSSSRSIVEQLEEEFGQPTVYTPATVNSHLNKPSALETARSKSSPLAKPNHDTGSPVESNLELEMKRKLAEILRSSLASAPR